MQLGHLIRLFLIVDTANQYSQTAHCILLGSLATLFGL
jgi:hypothetical protein